MTVPEQDKPENQDKDTAFRVDELTGAKLDLLDGPVLGMDDVGGGYFNNSSTQRVPGEKPADVDEAEGNPGNTEGDGDEVSNSSYVRNDEPADVEEADMKPEGTTSMDEVGGGSVPTSSSANPGVVDPDDEGGFAGPALADAKAAPKKRAAKKS